MFQTIRKLLGIGPKVDFGALITNGATIIDVRSQSEFADGNFKGSINIPLDKLSNQLSKLNKDKPIITVCASGMRSASARGILLTKGFKEVHNAGSWYNLRKYEK